MLANSKNMTLVLLEGTKTGKTDAVIEEKKTNISC